MGVRFAFCLCAVLGLTLSACSPDPVPAGPPEGPSWAPSPLRNLEFETLASTRGSDFVLHTESGSKTFIPGVNLGSTLPGHFPGALAVGADDYRRWFTQISDLGFRSIRVYAIHPPHFYEELRGFNIANPDRPLYLMQGVYLPGETYYFEAERGLFDKAGTDAFDSEIAAAVSAVYGDFERSTTPGRADGVFTADVSRWTLAYLIGVEWDPEATHRSDDLNGTAQAHAGKYFSSHKLATPTERWLAARIDKLAEAVAARGDSVPLGFVNWVTTDPLSHPEEPLPKEDLVGIDPNHVVASDAWPGGYFASYHAYPYYPDFLRYEPGLQAPSGTPYPYREYIRELQRHHAGIPLLITEFGVPTSHGLAHYGPNGLHQGGHRESEGMELAATMFDFMPESGVSGAWLFEWADEWFKFTWNTIDYQVPAGRRALWHDPWTNEQYFGVLAFEPGSEQRIAIDGDREDWSDQQVIHESRGGVRQIRATHDESFTYLGIAFDEEPNGPVGISVDVISGGEPVGPGNARSVDGADYFIRIEPDGDAAQAYTVASNDHNEKRYAYGLGYLKPSGERWNPQTLITNRPFEVAGRAYDAETFNIGRLMRGVTDRGSPEFNSLAMWELKGRFLEIRIPHMTMGFSDPSSLQARVVGENGVISTSTVDRIKLGVSLGSELATGDYGWEQWQKATYHERLKNGSDTLAETLYKLAP